MKKLLSLLLGLSLLFPAQVFAGPTNDNISIYLDGRGIFSIVDQQTWCGDCVAGEDITSQEPWTVNPGWVDGYTPPILVEATGGSSNRGQGCMWDSDDWFEYHTTGNVFPPNTTLTATECRWRQPGRYTGVGASLMYFQFASASPDLVIKAKWDWGVGSFTYTLPAPIKQSTNGTYVYGGATSYGQKGTCVWAPIENPVAPSVAVPGSHDGSGQFEVITLTITNPTNKKAPKSGGFIGTDYRDNSIWCNYPFTEL